MLEVRDLNAYYGKSHILQGVSFDVQDGEIVSLLGRNGVGRSTTCKAIMGDVAPHGSVRFKGEELVNRLKFDEAKEEFKKAIALDSLFALAHYRLAYAAGWNQEVLTGQYINRAMELIDRLPERERYLVRVEKATVDSGWAAALRVLREMEQEYPDDKEMLYNIGDMSYHLADYATAQEYLERVLSMDPTFERALQHLAWTYRDTDQGEKMLEVAKRYVNASGSAEAYGLLAAAYGATGRYDEGLNAMRAAQELFPENASPTLELSTLLMQMGSDTEAERELRGALRHFDRLSDVQSLRLALSGIYQYRGQFREAINQTRAIRRIAAEKKDSTILCFTYGYEGLMMTRGWGYSDSAWSVARRMLEFPRQYILEPNIPAILGWIQLTRNNWAYADSLARDAPAPLKIFLNTVTTCRRGTPREAKAAVDSVVAMGLPPEPRQIMSIMLAENHIKAGEYRSALDIAREAQQLNLPRNAEFSRTYYLIGRAHEGLREYPQARKAYEEFLHLWSRGDPDLPDLMDAKRRLAALGSAT